MPSDKSKTAKRGDFTGISVFTLCQSSVPAMHCSQNQKQHFEQNSLNTDSNLTRLPTWTMKGMSAMENRESCPLFLAIPLYKCISKLINLPDVQSLHKLHIQAYCFQYTKAKHVSTARNCHFLTAFSSASYSPHHFQQKFCRYSTPST